MTVRMKICCIGSVDEAAMAVRSGASAIGLVSEMPSGPGVIDETLIAEIAAATSPPTETFLLTSRTAPDAITEQHGRTGVTTIQICDRLADDAHDRLRETLPGVRLVQVIHVLGEDSVQAAVEVADGVDALLLDSGSPQGAVRELGGTGRTHDWSVSRAIVEAVDVPVWLAGGLNPVNVAEAIDRVRPFGVDVCSGVRTNGRLDPRKLEAFAAAR